MPFEKIYDVDFRVGPQPHPNFNPYNWPPIQVTSNSPPDTEHQWSPAGLDLKISRRLTIPEAPEIRNSVWVVPPQSIPMNSRLHMKVTLIHPNANNGGVLPSATVGWAIGLRFSTKDDILTAKNSAIVTLRFEEFKNASGQNNIGAQLNTPSPLQTDQPQYVETHVDYSAYNPAPPFFNQVPVFTVEHSFSGWKLSPTDPPPPPPPGKPPLLPYSLSAGFLRISRSASQDITGGSHDVTDYRINSKKTIYDGIATPDGIRAIGVNLATNQYIGTMSVRLLTLEIWRDIGSEAI